MPCSPDSDKPRLAAFALVALVTVCNFLCPERAFALTMSNIASTGQSDSQPPLIIKIAERGEQVYRTVRLRYSWQHFYVHAFPNEKSPITGHISPAMQTVELLGDCARYWCYVRFGSVSGWLRKEQLDLRPPSPRAQAIMAMLFHRPKVAKPVEAPPPPSPPQPQQQAVAALPPVAPKSLKQPAPTNIPFPSRKPILEAQPAPEQAVLNLNQPAISEQADSYTSSTSRLLIANIPQKTYGLAGFEGKSSLVVRGDRNDKAPILGNLLLTGEVEALGICVESWCLIRSGELRGWIEQRHLADKDLTGKPAFSFEAQAGENRLELYDFPKVGANVLREIIAPAKNITQIGECGPEWCHISYLGSAGWVNSKYLTRQ